MQIQHLSATSAFNLQVLQILAGEAVYVSKRNARAPYLCDET